MLKSFYTLEMCIQPGGGRQALLLVTDSIAEIKRSLELALSDNFQLYILLDYGEDIWLCAYQQCRMVCEIDLLPYLTVEIEDYGTFTIDESQQVTPDFPADLSDLLLDSDSESLNIKVFIDWSNLEIPVLEEPLLESGEATIFNDHYFNTEISPAEIAAFAAAQGDPDELAGFDVAEYGWNDREGGEDITLSDLFDEFDDIETDALRVVFR